jgi:hypothetical protein
MGDDNFYVAGWAKARNDSLTWCSAKGSLTLRGWHCRLHKLERLTGLNDLGRLAGTIGPWTGLAPDDSPLALRDVGTQEIYALELGGAIAVVPTAG